MEWVDKTVNWGVPMVILFLFAKWAAPKVDLLINSHLGMIDSLKKDSLRAARAIERQNELAEKMISKIPMQGDRALILARKVEEQDRVIQFLLERIVELRAANSRLTFERDWSLGDHPATLRER